MSEQLRDKSVDILLRQTLTRPAAVEGDCVDGETLAAWMSGTLNAPHASTVEHHLASCPRCQALMATFVRTAPAVQAQSAPWRRWRLAWLVPVASAAAALGIWLALPGRGPVPFQPESAPAPTSRDAAATAPASTAPAAASAEQSGPLIGTLAHNEEAGGPSATPQRANAPAASKQAPSPAEPTAPLFAPPPPGGPAVKQSLESDAEETRVAKTVTDQKAEAAPAATPAAPAAAEVLRAPAEAAQAIAQVPSFEVVAPDRSTRWRVTRSQSVQWMPSGATTWEPSDIAVASGLTSGSASSASTCWLAGRSGTLFVTSDGSRFMRVPFPESVDLVAVMAVDERTATVTAVDGRSWRTTNQGRSWTRVER